MGLLINGEWVDRWYDPDEKGRFQRPDTKFRHWVGSGDFTLEDDRYHLYVSYACPWAHRTLIARQLLGLQNSLTVSVVDPFMGDDGWWFSENPGCVPDFVNGVTYLRDVYRKAKSDYTGRVTVPILWDKKQSTIVNNESREILRMLTTKFSELHTKKADLCPERLKEKIDSTIDAIYEPINNGVYRAGFATTQNAYDEAVSELFDALDKWDSVLMKQEYLCGDQLTEADICLFTTLVRFDLVYYSHFKCNIQHLFDFAGLWPYLKRIYYLEGVAETCHFGHIKQHYYQSQPAVNPTQIVPKGPENKLLTGRADND